MTGSGRLRIALLTYRGNPYVGGQGVYVHYLSRALAGLGHRVDVFSGPPYPELDGRVGLVRVPSLDLYRPGDPFRRPARAELRTPVEVAEYGLMCTGAFPEPLTFSLRAARLLRRRASEYDVVHDNQCLGYGLLALARHLPLVATVHHPISIDRRMDLEQARDWKRRLSLRRWYSFVRMQGRVARRLPRLIAVSDAARVDLCREFRLTADRVGVVHNGVDTDLFRPLENVARIPGRIVTLASAAMPMKGLPVLIEAVAKLRAEMDAELVVVGRGGDGDGARAAVRRFGLESAVRFEGRVELMRLIELYAQAEVAVVASLYEGFSLPAVEAMSCGVPLVATTGGALPEVVGDAGALVPPGDPSALAAALGRLLRDGGERSHLGRAGRERVLARFTWKRAAEATVAEYERAGARC